MVRMHATPDLESTEAVRPGGHLDQQDMSMEKRLDDAGTPKNVDSALETYATIMTTNKPDPWGPGHIRLYLLAATIFLCSTMSG